MLTEVKKNRRIRTIICFFVTTLFNYSIQIEPNAFVVYIIEGAAFSGLTACIYVGQCLQITMNDNG